MGYWIHPRNINHTVAIYITRTQKKQSLKKGIIRLNTTPLSNFVEKIRWILDMEKIEYEEENDVGVLGIIFTGRTVPVLEDRNNRVHIGNSPQILNYLSGTFLESKLIQGMINNEEQRKN